VYAFPTAERLFWLRTGSYLPTPPTRCSHRTLPPFPTCRWTRRTYLRRLGLLPCGRRFTGRNLTACRLARFPPPLPPHPRPPVPHNYRHHRTPPTAVLNGPPRCSTGSGRWLHQLPPPHHTATHYGLRDDNLSLPNCYTPIILPQTGRNFGYRDWSPSPTVGHGWFERRFPPGRSADGGGYNAWLPVLDGRAPPYRYTFPPQVDVPTCTRCHHSPVTAFCRLLVVDAIGTFSWRTSGGVVDYGGDGHGTAPHHHLPFAV